MSNLVQMPDGTAAFTGSGLEWYDAEFTSVANFAAASGAAIDLSVQLRGRLYTGSPYSALGAGIGSSQRKVGKQLMLLGWLSAAASDPTPVSVTLTASVGFAIQIGTTLERMLIFDTTGLLTLSVTTTTNTRKINLVMPDGRIIQSPTLTWT